MDNLRKHFCKPSCSEPSCGRSTFHMPPPGSFAAQVEECVDRMANYVDNLSSFCGAGTYMTEAFARILQDSEYAETAGQFHGAMKEVCDATSCVGGQIKAKLDTKFHDILKKLDKNQESPTPENIQVIAKCFLQLMRLQCQFILTSTELLSQFCDCKKEEDMVSKPVRLDNDHASSIALQSLAALHIGGIQTDDASNWPSPKLLPEMEGQADIWGQNQLGNNTPSYVLDGQASKYGNIGSSRSPNGSLGYNLGVDDSSYSKSPWSSDSSKDDSYVEGCGITQEELDNVIDFLSVHPNYKNLQSIPESGPDSIYSHFHTQSSSLANSSRMDPDANHNDYAQQQNFSSDPSAKDVSYRSDSGCNTWPANLQQRGVNNLNNTAGDIETFQAYLPYGASAFESDPEFLNYVASIGAMIGHSNNYENHVWSTVDLKLNKSWPQPSIHSPAISEPTWTAGHHDSSSSDESANEDALISLAFRESASTGLSLDHESKTDIGPSEPAAEPVKGLRPPLPPKQPWAEPTPE